MNLYFSLPFVTIEQHGLITLSQCPSFIVLHELYKYILLLLLLHFQCLAVQPILVSPYNLSFPTLLVYIGWYFKACFGILSICILYAHYFHLLYISIIIIFACNVTKWMFNSSLIWWCFVFCLISLFLDVKNLTYTTMW